MNVLMAALAAVAEPLIGDNDRSYFRSLVDISPSRKPRMAIDPVCGMDVSPAEAKATASHDGITYYFCSEECKQRFKSNPEPYL
jgi:Cu+-exporting ATPase